jgi:hypothetical protein
MITITAYSYVWPSVTKVGKVKGSPIDGYLFSILFTPECCVSQQEPGPINPTHYQLSIILSIFE